MRIDNIPKFDSPEGVEILDKIVTCHLPCEDHPNFPLIKRLQVHQHRPTCFKNKNNCQCRFGFERPTSDITKIIPEEELIKNSGKFCILKRTEREVMVNNYNLTILKIWDANMDIQPVGSMYGAAYYVAKYVSKEESKQLKKDFQDAVKIINETDKKHLVKTLHQVINKLITSRERSAQEAAYILAGLRLRGSSRSTVFVNTNFSDKRSRMLKKESVLNHIYSEDDFTSDIFDKYRRRPDELENICLTEFATEYRLIYKTKENKKLNEDDIEEICNDDVDGDEFFSELFENKVENSKIQITKKKIKSVIKTPYFSFRENTSEYFYSLLFLYLPFREESEILKNFKDPPACFNANKNKLKIINSDESLLKQSEELQLAIDRLEILISENNEYDNLKHAFDSEDVEKENLAYVFENIEDDKFQTIEIDETSLRERIKKMNAEQRVIYENFRNFLIQKQKNSNGKFSKLANSDEQYLSK